jgi:hypothetical protein
LLSVEIVRTANLAKSAMSQEKLIGIDVHQATIVFRAEKLT